MTAVLFSLFLLPAAVLPQCDYRLDYSGQYRSSVFDVSVDGMDLWTATGYGVQLFDRSIDPPRLVASVAAPGTTRIVRAAAGVTYAAGTGGIHVIRRNGDALQLVRTIAVAGVNDLAVGATALYVATSSGLLQFDRLTLEQSPVVFSTSRSSVTSLALSGTTLYAADDDATVEVFSVITSAPQKLGTIASLDAAASVVITGSRLYVSDGQRTDLFTGNGTTMTRLATLSFPVAHAADLSTNVIFAAGNDRLFRAVDLTTAGTPIVLFEQELIPAGGTVNRIGGLATATARLYVAAGDMGLVTYDTSRFTAPYPLRAYEVGAATSLAAGATAVYLGKASGGIQELTRSSTGSLTAARQWGAGTFLVHDEAGGFLIASTGPTLNLWTLTSTTPTLIASATFAKPVLSAGLAGTKAIVLLDDGSLWTADMGAATPSPLRVATTIGPAAQLAVSDTSVAAAEVLSDGTTTIHFWNGSNLDAAPVNATVSGAATALAVDARTAAVFTYRGITVMNFSGSAASPVVLPQSNTAIVSSLRISGDRLLALTGEALRVWNLSTGAFDKELPIPGGGSAVDVGGSPAIAAVQTATGVVSVNYSAPTSLPAGFPRLMANTYYRKAAASSSRLSLFDGRNIDIFDLTGSPAPRFLASISGAGLIDLTAFDGGIFTLSSSGVVSAYSADGALLASKALDEGAGVIPLSIAAVAGVPWVSISRGCQTSGCEKKTIVLDPQSLVRTASLSGGTIDATTQGTHAVAITDLPPEIRVYDLADRLHPAQIATRANDVGALSVAFSAGTVYALADKVYAYDATTLTKSGERLAAVTPASSARILVDGGCAVLAGRSATVDTYAVPSWSTASPLSVPGSVRTLALGSGRLLVLTDYSLEIWSRGAPLVPRRRRAAR